MEQGGVYWICPFDRRSLRLSHSAQRGNESTHASGRKFGKGRDQRFYRPPGGLPESQRGDCSSESFALPAGKRAYGATSSRLAGGSQFALCEEANQLRRDSIHRR